MESMVEEDGSTREAFEPRERGSSVKKMDKRKAAKRDKRKAAKMSKRKAAKRDKRKAAKRGKMEERKVVKRRPGGKRMMGMRSRLAGERLLGHSMKRMFGRVMKMRKEWKWVEVETIVENE